MGKLSFSVTAALRENTSILMRYAFSQIPLQTWVDESLKGEFKQFHQTLFDIPQQRAERSCVELALLLRYLDDEENLSEAYKGETSSDFGYLVNSKGETEFLSLRDVANKMIHARSFKWDFSVEKRPMLICESRDTDSWVKAEVNIATLSVVLGSLMG